MIAVFLKDPKQIVEEFKLRGSSQSSTMDFENSNCLHLDDALRTTNSLIDSVPNANQTSSLDQQFSDIDNFKMHVDLMSTVTNDSPEETTKSDFRFGNDGEEDSSRQRIDDVTDEENDDFGPETDVDATDDTAISPLMPNVNENDILLNNALNVDLKPNFDNGYDFIESGAGDVYQSVEQNVNKEEVRFIFFFIFNINSRRLLF